MRNSVHLDDNHNEAIRAEIGDRLSYLLSGEASATLTEDELRIQDAHIRRLQLMEQDTADPLASRLLQDIISEMEAELKEQVDRLVAERH